MSRISFVMNYSQNLTIHKYSSKSILIMQLLEIIGIVELVVGAVLVLVIVMFFIMSRLFCYYTFWQKDYQLRKIKKYAGRKARPFSITSISREIASSAISKIPML